MAEIALGWPSALSFLVVGVPLVVLVLWGRRKKREASTTFCLPPGPGWVPLVGSIPFLPKSLRSRRGLHIPKVFQHLSRTYGKVSCLHLGPVRTIVLADCVVLREAFRREELSSRPLMRPYDELRYGGPDGSQRGLFFSSGKEWTDQRRFTLHHLKSLGFGKSSMEDLLLEEVDKLLCLLTQELASMGKNPKGEKVVDLNLKMNVSVVNALWVLLVGERLDLNDQKLKGIVKTVDAMLRSSKVTSLAAILFPWIFKTFSSRFATAKSVAESVKHLLRPILQEKLQSENLESSCFVNSYLNEIRKVTDVGDDASSFYGEKGIQSLEIVLMDLFLGGSETTATSLKWVILYMLHHPEVQDLVHAELDHVVGRENQVQLEDSSRLPYVNAVIAETHRKASVAPSGLPHFVSEDVYVSGFVFPKGSTVMASISAIHHDPEIWENPEEFDPLRFIDDQGKFKPNSNLVPFSIGKRFCVGQSLVEKQFFLFFSNLMLKFRFLRPESSDLSNIRFQDDNENIGFVRQPPHYLVHLQPRV